MTARPSACLEAAAERRRRYANLRRRAFMLAFHRANALPDGRSALAGARGSGGLAEARASPPWRRARPCSGAGVKAALRRPGWKRGWWAAVTPPAGTQAIACALACGKSGCACGKRGITHCPAHGDVKPSLNVKEGDGGKVLVKCFAGCTQEAVIGALQERGLWPQAGRGVDGVDQRKATGLTVAELAEAKGLDAGLLRDVGVRDGVAGRLRAPCADVPYLGVDGEVVAVRKRLRLTGEPRFIWRRGDHVAPYGLWRLRDARTQGHVMIVEGESDAWTLWQAGIPALGVSGASTWKQEWARHLNGIGEVYVWREPDSGGDTLTPKVAASLPDVRIIEAPPEAKDSNEIWGFFGRDTDTFRQRMQELMSAARPASALRAEALTVEAREVFDKARHLLEAPDLLDRIAEAIRASGYAGDTTPALLSYIAVTSRLLERPMNLAFVAPSAAGKNKAIDAALDLMPGSAFHLEGAGTPRALIYGDENFQHRTVVVAEADSIPDDGPAASADRALAADNCMSYDVVERDAETGKFTVRHIVKPGPTGLITTSIKPLPWQMDTRVLTVPLLDTREQTQAVLAAHAAAVHGDAPSVDGGPFLALQRWLELAGDRRVTIPFAHALAQAVPAGQIRMRRDFRQLLTAIQAVALLYQRQRQPDGQGRIVAMLEDYRLARQLLLDVFTAAATGGVSQTVREAVEAVAALYDGEHPVTVKAVGDHLGLAKNSALYRVRRAIVLGYLNNLETAKGRSARLVPGDALPDERPALPEPEELGGGVCVSPGNRSNRSLRPLSGPHLTGRFKPRFKKLSNPSSNRPVAGFQIRICPAWGQRFNGSMKNRVIGTSVPPGKTKQAKQKRTPD